jgi:hypothetical protein
MTEEELVKKLDSIGDAGVALDGLMRDALKHNRARLALALYYTETLHHHDGERDLSLQVRDFDGTSALQQVLEFYAGLCEISDLWESDETSQRVRKRMWAIAYASFWECIAVQSTLFGLARAASGDRLDLAWKDGVPKTHQRYEKICKQLRKTSHGSELRDSLMALYHSQLRNAIFHSQFYILEKQLIFCNADRAKKTHIRAISIATWEKLVCLFSEFVGALFNARRRYLDELKSLMPLKANLPELPNIRSIQLDDRGQLQMGVRQLPKA